VRLQSLTNVRVPYGGGHVDDAPAFNAMVKNCSTNATILFREGINYQMMSVSHPSPVHIL
jgi:hypothetical protein